MKRFITYLYSGAYYFWGMLREIGLRTIVPIIGKFFAVVFNLCPPVKRNLMKRGLTVGQYIYNSTLFIKKMQRNDVTGSLKRHFENTLMWILFLFFAETVCILRRILNIDELNKLIHNYKFAVLIVCMLFASFCVTKIENFVLKGKRLTSLDRKPKDFRHKALFVFFASCFITIFVFLKLWWW